MTLVVKVGGRALRANMQEILRDLARLVLEAGRRAVLVHGGGDIVTEFSKKLGIEPKFVVSPSGIRSRYTSREELEVYVMVMAGKINKEIVGGLTALGVQAIGLSGADARLLEAERKKRIIIIDERGRKRVIEGGFTGKITRVNTGVAEKLLDLGYTLVVSPIAINSDGTLLNVDADQAACAIAGALRAEELVMLSDVDGLILDEKVVPKLGASEIESILPRVGVGMNRKLLMIREALAKGVGKAVIASGLVENPVTKALSGAGTVVEG